MFKVFKKWVYIKALSEWSFHEKKICFIIFILTYEDVKSEEIKEISGFAKIIDGDTIKINSKKIRLHVTLFF